MQQISYRYNICKNHYLIYMSQIIQQTICCNHRPLNLGACAVIRAAEDSNFLGFRNNECYSEYDNRLYNSTLFCILTEKQIFKDIYLCLLALNIYKHIRNNIVQMRFVLENLQSSRYIYWIKHNNNPRKVGSILYLADWIFTCVEFWTVLAFRKACRATRFPTVAILLRHLVPKGHWKWLLNNKLTQLILWRM